MQTTRVYLDDSNIWVEGMKLMARQRGLGGDRDPRWRMHVSRLVAVAASGGAATDDAADLVLDSVCLHVYGSSGSADGASRAMLQSLRGAGANVHVFERSSRGREKEVDQALTVDLVADATRLSVLAELDEAVARLKAATLMVVLSGDRDMRPAVRRVLSYGIRVRLCAFSSSLAVEYRQLAAEEPLFEVLELDDHLDAFSYTNFVSTRSADNIDPQHALAVRLEDTEHFSSDGADPAVVRLCQHLLASRALFYVSEHEGLLVVEFPHLDLDRALAAVRRLVSPAAAVQPFVFAKQHWQRQQQRHQQQQRQQRQHEAVPQRLCFRNLSIHDGDDHADEDDDEDDDGHEVLSVASLSTASDTTFDDSDQDDGFQVVRRGESAAQRERRVRRRSQQCPRGIHCEKAAECAMQHTPEQQRLFRLHPTCQFRNWKTVQCTRRSAHRQHDCPYAHADADTFCTRCRTWGHLRTACSPSH